jgi:hypothetical protein
MNERDCGDCAVSVRKGGRPFFAALRKPMREAPAKSQGIAPWLNPMMKQVSSSKLVIAVGVRRKAGVLAVFPTKSSSRTSGDPPGDLMARRVVRSREPWRCGDLVAPERVAPGRCRGETLVSTLEAKFRTRERSSLSNAGDCPGSESGHRRLRPHRPSRPRGLHPCGIPALARPTQKKAARHGRPISGETYCVFSLCDVRA